MFCLYIYTNISTFNHTIKLIREYRFSTHARVLLSSRPHMFTTHQNVIKTFRESRHIKIYKCSVFFVQVGKSVIYVCMWRTLKIAHVSSSHILIVSHIISAEWKWCLIGVYAWWEWRWASSTARLTTIVSDHCDSMGNRGDCDVKSCE